MFSEAETYPSVATFIAFGVYVEYDESMPAQHAVCMSLKCDYSIDVDITNSCLWY